MTITLYKKPKKDPRPKIHIQGGDQSANLEFVVEKLPLFYNEVNRSKGAGILSQEIKSIQRAMCGKCGKSFINKKGVKQHILRMHVGKPKLSVEDVNLEEPDIVSGELERVNQMPLSRIISVENSPKIMVSPAQKKLRREENESAEEDLDNSELIQNLLEEVQDNVINKIQENSDNTNQNDYQCGEKCCLRKGKSQNKACFN